MRIECENLLDDLEPLLHDIEAEWAEMTGLAAEHSRTNLNALIFSSYCYLNRNCQCSPLLAECSCALMIAHKIFECG